METQRARRDKRQADAVMALDDIREKKLESVFPGKTLKKLTALENAQTVTEPVLHHKSDGKCQTATEKSGFIRSLIVTGHRIKAIDYIYSLDMVLQRSRLEKLRTNLQRRLQP